jgi:hypothetical protein
MDSGYRRRKLFDDDDEDEGGAQGKWNNHSSKLNTYNTI